MIDSFRDEYFFLSNFYEASVTYEGITYPHNEAAFQAMKVLDDAERMRFVSMTPDQAKYHGRRVKLRYDWESVKFDVMLGICRAKFTQNPELAKLLIATGDEELVEGNTWHDTTWGVYNGKGKNYLGKILMLIRDELKENNNV